MLLDRYCADQSTVTNDSTATIDSAVTSCPFNGQVNASLYKCFGTGPRGVRAWDPACHAACLPLQLLVTACHRSCLPLLRSCNESCDASERSRALPTLLERSWHAPERSRAAPGRSQDAPKALGTSVRSIKPWFSQHPQDLAIATIPIAKRKKIVISKPLRLSWNAL